MSDLKKQVEDLAIKPEENVKCGLTLSIQPIPPSLQGLTNEEIESLEKQLVKKLDIRLMPMLVLIYIMNYLDRYYISIETLEQQFLELQVY